MVNDMEIINYFLGSTHGIRQTARRFSLPMIYVAKIILRYKKKKRIR